MNIRWILPLSLCLMLSGCGPKIHMPNFIKETPTPKPVTSTPVPTKAPMSTSTPTPTVTPAPRMIGSKNGSAGAITLTNATGMRFRQIYIQTPGGDGWGRNLIPAESSIHTGEVFMLYYPSGSQQFNILLRDTSGVTYEMNNVSVGEIENGVLSYDTVQQDIYLTYYSKASQSEMKVTGYSGGSAPATESSYNSSYDAGYYEDYDYYDWDVETIENSNGNGENGTEEGQSTDGTGNTEGGSAEGEGGSTETGSTETGNTETGDTGTGETDSSEEAPFPITNEDYYETQG